MSPDCFVQISIKIDKLINKFQKEELASKDLYLSLKEIGCTSMESAKILSDQLQKRNFLC